jgi:hypothetical protein
LTGCIPFCVMELPSGCAPLLGAVLVAFVVLVVLVAIL